jgi:DNA-binding transcriptional LysR family regulator
MQITTFGQSFAVDVQAALSAVDDLFGPANVHTDEAVGVVRINAPHGLGRHYVQPILIDMMTRHRGLVADLRLSDTPSGVVDE